MWGPYLFFWHRLQLNLLNRCCGKLIYLDIGPLLRSDNIWHTCKYCFSLPHPCALLSLPLHKPIFPFFFTSIPLSLSFSLCGECVSPRERCVGAAPSLCSDLLLRRTWLPKHPVGCLATLSVHGNGANKPSHLHQLYPHNQSLNVAIRSRTRILYLGYSEQVESNVTVKQSPCLNTSCFWGMRAHQFSAKTTKLLRVQKGW